VNENLKIFGEFQDIHDKYVLNPDVWQVKFNEVGKEAVSVIRDWERKLCRQSEKGQYGKYSATLADKFWDLARKDFPKIDFVGVTIS